MPAFSSLHLHEGRKGPGALSNRLIVSSDVVYRHMGTESISLSCTGYTVLNYRERDIYFPVLCKHRRVTDWLDAKLITFLKAGFVALMAGNVGQAY